MDIAKIPIVDFLKYCKQGARQNGYYWIVCILCREADSRGLYRAILRDWQSLDSITGQRMLVLLAGDEAPSYLEDTNRSYVRRYSPFATVIGCSNISVNLPSVRHRALQSSIEKIEACQIDAVESLKRFLGIKEMDIPCLVYIPLYPSVSPAQNRIVPFPSGEIDLYSYFKRLFEEISPLVDSLYATHEQSELAERIDGVYAELLELIKDDSEKEILLGHIKKKKYYTCSQPIRGQLSRYVDLCRNYKEKTGCDYNPDRIRQSELMAKIEDAFVNTDIPHFGAEPVNAYISIGDNNKIKSSQISIVLEGTQEGRT